MNNAELFEYSLRNPESLVDDFYIKDGDLIISDSPNEPNLLMRTNREVLDNITAYRVATNQGNDQMRTAILRTIRDLIKKKGLNFSEFSSFWAVLDVSHSLYRKSLSEEEQLAFLDSTIKKYVEMRHEIYLNHGYTATTLQVGKDAKAHKSNGSLGSKKVAAILTEHGYTRLNDLTLESFRNGDKVFFLCDKNKKGERLFREVLRDFHIAFLWSGERQNKMPDVLFKNGNDIFIVEHKHMKEGGGGQDKQITEIVGLVGYSEPKATATVHYVTFLDGLYFNLFARQGINNTGKLAAQVAHTRRNLEANRENYFVNTSGFRALLGQLATQ